MNARIRFYVVDGTIVGYDLCDGSYRIITGKIRIDPELSGTVVMVEKGGPDDAYRKTADALIRRFADPITGKIDADVIQVFPYICTDSFSTVRVDWIGRLESESAAEAPRNLVP